MTDDGPPVEQQWPMTIEQIAARWSCGVRWLKGHARQHGIGRRAGRRVLFDEEEYRQLYESLPSASKHQPVYRETAVPSAARELIKARRLIAEAKQRGRRRRGGPQAL